MATEFTVMLQNKPGELANLTEALAKHGVNITAINATPCPEQAIVQFVTSNSDATIEALKVANIEYTTRQVLLIRLADHPGALARLARTLANEGININAVYITMNGQLVLDTDNLHAAQKIALRLSLI